MTPSPAPPAAGPAPQRRSLWRRYLDVPLIWKMAAALVAGAATGLAVGEPVTVIQPLGEVFLRLLQMLVMPLILLTLIAGVSSLTPARLGRIGAKIMVYYLLTSALAVTVGVALALAVAPGAGLEPPQGGADPEPAPPVTETLLNIVPDNPFAALAEGNVLAVMFAAVTAGLALAFMRSSGEEPVRAMGELLARAVEAGVELVNRVVRGVLEYAPVGVFALIAVVLGQTGPQALLPLLELTGVVYGGVGAQLVLYAALLAVLRVPVLRFFAHARDAMVMAFVTRSSNGTLPVTTRCARRMGVDDGVSSFTLPLGATVNMDGTAIYVGAATVFVANVAGVQLGLEQLAMVVLVGVVASVGTAGVPGAGLIMLSLTVSQAGLPFAAVALVAGIDAVLDMVRTMCNVTGDLVGTRVVARTEPGMVHTPARGEQAKDAQEQAGPAGGAGPAATAP
ncbi:dicarboxylate/amino acid:cation symporter [Streptomonospora nanhaiensis]|uniref:Na+/H+-dicarboxylate symporter n=1 Tax=Streptomonospora nanhaiensis TaxID=1323731 RepID=A0A853BG83_9ACTN|nr:dicarboxylate/amino acid:cation symporter [Streptomonospora nanhaiensis]MBX9389255.1 dicarboxylate/amino acid:cation symporter [Streptomonospora nanhaiensis]NYI94349.1 Na+/H+-dicarboxylate symporter [Streptomonospora nanhaiensis]